VTKSFVRKRLARLAGIAWLWLFCGAVVLFAGIPLVRNVYMSIASSSWVPTAAKVLAVESRSKSAELTYEYVVGETRYTGNTFAFLSWGTIPDKHVIEGSYRVGDRIQVYVNPANPAQSVVAQRSVGIEYVFTPLALIVLVSLVGWHVLGDLKKR
jgi:uncharacterized protein DUF3592